MNSTHWLTRQGQLIAIADMEDSHLANAILFMESRAPKLHRQSIDRLTALLDIDEAHDLDDQIHDQLDHIWSQSPEMWLDNHPTYVALKTEQKRRLHD